MRNKNLICAGLLLLVTLTSFWPVGRLGFILLDDWDYVYKNPPVQAGLNLNSIHWAFTVAHSSNWHPLTWLSHMLDCELFGLNPAGHHWVNLGFHSANTLLLFLLLVTMVRARWRSFLVAALFACHPMHIESVAWISERKDVLSGFFALLTLMAYTHYCRRKSSARYLTALLLFALGLMAKPMLVTLPVILLLLDFWPLNRWGIAPPDKFKRKSSLADFIKNGRPLFIEKIPFFLLSAASCVITIWAQRTGGSVISLNQIAWNDRLLHAIASYSLYLEKLVWPTNLAIFYPYTATPPDELFCLILVPIVLSILCLWRGRTEPYLFVGWFWFVITLLPVIGLMQVGMQSMANRYTYLPAIGLFVAAAWAMAHVAARSRFWRTGMALGGAVLILVCVVDTRCQLGYWRSNITLFTHVVEVTRENNFVGYFHLGNSYGEAGDLDGAARSFRSALEVAPGFKDARGKLGYVLLFQKKYDEAALEFSEVLRLHPTNIFARVYLGHALVMQDRYTDAQAEYQAALQLKPDDADLRSILAANSQRIQASQALTGLDEMVKTNATAEVHVQIATMQTILGNYSLAIQHYNTALSLKPDAPDALNNLAWLLATCPEAGIRDGARAVPLAEQACQLTQFNAAVFLGTLAAAYAEAGRFNVAIATAIKACALAEAAGEKNLLQKNRELLELYRAHKPYRDVPAKVIPAMS